MTRLEFTLALDVEMLDRVIGYYIYRSQEQDAERKRPLIDGVYIQRNSVVGIPPSAIHMSLDWEEKPPEN